MAELGEGSTKEVTGISFPETRIPDASLVTSQISLIPQSIQVHYDELGDYFDWIKEVSKSPDAQSVIRKGALLTINNLKPGDEQWEEIVGADLDTSYTLGRSIREGVNSCFQRSVFLNTIMDQTDMQTATMEGRWVESSREDLKTPPEKVLSMTFTGHFIGEGDKSDGHVWNLVKSGEDVYLVDSSYLTKDEGKLVPVVQKIDYKEGQKYFNVKLPSGETRHYVADGTIKVKPLAA